MSRSGSAAPCTGAYLDVDATDARVIGGLLQSAADLGERAGRRKAALPLLADVSAQLQIGMTAALMHQDMIYFLSNNSAERGESQ